MDFFGSHELSRVAYHGAPRAWKGAPRISPSRGLFFSTDIDYAAGYGSTIYQARVTLKNPLVYSEAQSQGRMELDMRKIQWAGYDGRVIRYDDGNMDIIVFSPDQIEVLDVLHRGTK